MSIGNRIRQAREQKGYCQQYVAGQLDLSQGGYRKIETGEVKLKVDTLLLIAKLLEVELTQLLGEPQGETRPTSAKPGSQPAPIRLPDSFARERQLYEQLLQNQAQLLLSQEAQLGMQQSLLVRYQAELNQLKAGLFTGQIPGNAPDPDAEFAQNFSQNPHPGHGNLLYRNNYLEVYHNAHHGWLYKNWLYLPAFAGIRQGCQVVLQLLEATKTSKLLADTRLVEGDWQEAREWIAQQWFPPMHQAGLRHFACIYSPDPASRRSAEAALQSNTGAMLRAFGSAQQARQWLLSA